VEALVGGGLPDPAIQEKRLASLKPTSRYAGGASYSLALAQFGPFIGHDGTLPGFQSFMGHDPITESTLVVFTNLNLARDGLETANLIARDIIGLLFSASPADATPVASPTA